VSGRAHAIHHISAITADLERNFDFYTRVLGLRLVKRTVNQDDVRSLHFFYADRAGTPGTDITFFHLPRVAASQPGPGTVAMIYFRVQGSSLDWWESRLTEEGAQPTRGLDYMEREAIAFADTEGQRILMVDDTGMAGEFDPWESTVPGEMAIRGIAGVDLESARPALTRTVIRDILGFQDSDRSGALFDTSDESSFATLRLVSSNAKRPGRVGAGGVHHVAFRVRDEQELSEMQQRIESKGISTSGAIDRFYFKSLYFREPGGILFELATEGPGFSVDEPLDALGQRLSLPPALAERRAEIESGLDGRWIRDETFVS
jgi:glyoxalase family protein